MLSTLGLIPFWTKRNPDYGSMLKTINCRDDSLYEDRGMWTNMKKKKRAIIVAEGFYEWLKKNNGKDRLPYYTKRKDGQLMCFAGLWDCVQYEGESHFGPLCEIMERVIPGFPPAYHLLCAPYGLPELTLGQALRRSCTRIQSLPPIPINNSSSCTTGCQ